MTSPDREALLPHLVDRVLDGAAHRPHGDDARLGVLGAIAADQPARIAAEAGAELAGVLGDQPQRLGLFVVGEELHLHEGLGPDHGADRRRLVGIEHLHRLERRQIGVDVGLRGDVDPLHRMGEDETVDVDHHRHRQFFGDAERLDV